jgi:putative ABC transport system permease protein
MNVLKRAGLSIIRRPGKTLILFLVVFIIGNLIAGAVLIRQAIMQTEEAALSMMGATVSLQIDNNAVMEAYSAGGGIAAGPQISNVNAETIEQLGRRPEVKYFDYSLDEYLGSKGLNTVKAAGGDNEGMHFGSASNFILRGIHYAPLLPLQEGKLSLSEGRSFTEDEIKQGSLVTMVSDRLAEENGLHVGDSLSLTAEIVDYGSSTFVSMGPDSTMPESTVKDSKDITLEIIGIFKIENLAFENQQEGLSLQERLENQMKGEVFNTVYAPMEVAREIDDFLIDGYAQLDTSSATDDYTYLYTASYVLDQISDLESFELAAQAALPEYWTTLSARSEFEQAAAPLETIKNLMDTALIVIVAAALVIITLIVVLFLRDRRHEFGIYLSLGERTTKILSQVASEVVLVAAVALCLALVSGMFLSHSVSDFMLNAQLDAAQSSGMTQDASQGSVVMVSAGASDPLSDTSIDLDTILEQYQIGFSASYALLFFGVGLGTVLLACIFPLLYVLRLKPKKILM